jgi:hypothetical protein
VTGRNLDDDQWFAGLDRISGQNGAAPLDRSPPQLQRVDWHQLWTADADEEWILEPLLPARRLVAIYSAPKVGKSLLLLEVAVAISRGEMVLGTTPPRAYRVLYVDYENDLRGDVRQRLRAMNYGPDDLNRLDFLSFPAIATLDSEAGGSQLLAAVTEWRDEVVIIDTVSRAVAGEENSNDTWLSFYRHTGLRLKQAGVSLVRLDHSGKDSGRGQRGGSAKSGDVDAVWRLSKVTDTVLRLDLDEARLPISERMLTLHRETVPRLHHRVDAYGRAAAWDAKLAETIAALDAAGIPPETGERAAGAALRERGFSTSNNALREALKVRRNRLPGLTLISGAGCAESETAQSGAPGTETAPPTAPHPRVARRRTPSEEPS